MKKVPVSAVLFIAVCTVLSIAQQFTAIAKDDDESTSLSAKQIWNKQAVNFLGGIGFTPQASSFVLNFGMMKPITERIRATSFFDLYLSTKSYDNERTMWQCGLHVNGQYLVLPAKVVKIYALGGISLNQITKITAFTGYNQYSSGSLSESRYSVQTSDTKLAFDIGAGLEFPETVGIEFRYATHIDAFSANLIIR